MAQWNKGSGFSGDEMMRMQRDAERRVREMQKRADMTLHQGQNLNSNSTGQTGYAQPQTQSTGQSQTPHKQETRPPSSTPHDASLGEHEQHRAGSAEHRHEAASNNQEQHNHRQTPPAPQSSQNQSPLSGLLSSFMGGSSSGGSSGGILSGLFGGSGKEGNSPISKVLSALNLDNERIILIFLVILLLNEGGDSTLIIALCYLIL